MVGPLCVLVNVGSMTHAVAKILTTAALVAYMLCLPPTACQAPFAFRLAVSVSASQGLISIIISIFIMLQAPAEPHLCWPVPSQYPCTALKWPSTHAQP